MSTPTAPTWLTVFLDVAPGTSRAVAAFWSAVTGHPTSPWRGARGEFTSLVPPDGDVALKVQERAAGEDRLHLDLSVPDTGAAADAAVGLGAALVERSPHGYVVLTSPAGTTFCFVPHVGARVAAPAAWPGGHRSAVDQVVLDVPSTSYDAELAFWAALTGWRLRTFEAHPDFAALVPPGPAPWQLLVQRLGEPDGPARAHLDLSAGAGVAAEVARHAALGAEVVAEHAEWTVLRGPGAAAHCVTDREPGPR